jgi:hypothetical protein
VTINTASIAGIEGQLGHPAYSASSPPIEDLTLMGRPDTGLLVVAGFDTPARVVGLITAQRRHGRPSAAS